MKPYTPHADGWTMMLTLLAQGRRHHRHPCVSRQPNPKPWLFPRIHLSVTGNFGTVTTPVCAVLAVSLVLNWVVFFSGCSYRDHGHKDHTYNVGKLLLSLLCCVIGRKHSLVILMAVHSHTVLKCKLPFLCLWLSSRWVLRNYVYLLSLSVCAYLHAHVWSHFLFGMPLTSS